MGGAEEVEGEGEGEEEDVGGVVPGGEGWKGEGLGSEGGGGSGGVVEGEDGGDEGFEPGVGGGV